MTPQNFGPLALIFVLSASPALAQQPPRPQAPGSVPSTTGAIVRTGEGIVEEASGKVLWNGAVLSKGAVFVPEGVLETGPGAKARVRISGTASFNLVENAKLRLGKAKPVNTGEKESGGEILGAELLAGTSRWVTDRLAKGKAAGKYQLRTKSAVMGVRGTDFMAVYNPLLGESEIVVFGGQVVFQNRAQAKDRKLVGPGQWGGVGGRFGQKIGDLINLPANVLQTFDGATSVGR